MIVSALMLFSWIAGVFSNKKIDEESPEENISSYNAPEIEMNNKDNQTPEVQPPEPLSNPENDAPEEIISSDDNIPTIVQMDKDLDNEKPEVPMPEPLSHPQQDAPDVEIENLIKILDAANHQLSRVALLLAEVDKPDESDEDSDESEDEGPPHSFADTETLNETDEETPEVLTPQFDPEVDAIVTDITDPKITADATNPSGLEALIETDKRTQPDAHSEVAGETDNNLAENINFTFKVTKFPNLPDPYYITLNLNEPVNGKIRKTKIISTRDPQWNKKSFSFYVRNAEDATITCKLKRKALLGLKKSTKKVKTTKLINNGKEFQLLTDFKVAVVTQVTEVKETKRELAKKKREKRKLKERLAFCEKNGIDPYVRMGSDETFGQLQKDQNTEETKWIFISGKPRETIV